MYDICSYIGNYSCTKEKGINFLFILVLNLGSYVSPCKISTIYKKLEMGGAHGVMVIVVGNGHGDTSSNPARD